MAKDVARVSALWRHPVKSLQGEQVARAVVVTQGVVGDRRWGIRDVATAAVLSAKREPRLLLAGARAAGEGVAVSVPGCGEVVGTAADALLSEWLGREVRVETATVDPFVDEAHLHVVAATELGDWDVRRFRPNVVVEGVADLDALMGERLRLGDIVVEITKRTKRCAMPTMRQPGLDKDVSVLRTLAHERELRLGVYARVVVPGILEPGMPVLPA